MKNVLIKNVVYSVTLQFGDKLPQCFSWLLFLHKAFTNEKTTEAGTAQLAHDVGVANP